MSLLLAYFIYIFLHPFRADEAASSWKYQLPPTPGWPMPWYDRGSSRERVLRPVPFEQRIHLPWSNTPVSVPMSEL